VSERTPARCTPFTRGEGVGKAGVVYSTTGQGRNMKTIGAKLVVVSGHCINDSCSYSRIRVHAGLLMLVQRYRQVHLSVNHNLYGYYLKHLVYYRQSQACPSRACGCLALIFEWSYQKPDIYKNNLEQVMLPRTSKCPRQEGPHI
jgi:hypothetical protein